MKGPELRVTVNASDVKPEGSSEYIESDHSDSLSPFSLPPPPVLSSPLPAEDGQVRSKMCSGPS